MTRRWRWWNDRNDSYDCSSWNYLKPARPVLSTAAGLHYVMYTFLLSPYYGNTAIEEYRRRCLPFCRRLTVGRALRLVISMYTGKFAMWHHYYAPPLIYGGIKRWCCLTSVCLSVCRSVCLTSDVCLTLTSGLSREQRGLTKIGTEVANVARDSDITFKVKGQRSRSSGRFTHRGVNASASCSGDRRNVLTVGTYCYLAVCFSAHRGRREAGHIVAAARLLVYCRIGEFFGKHASTISC